MQLISLLALGGLASTAVARSAKYSGKNFEVPRPRFAYPQSTRHAKRAAEPIIVQNNVTTSK
jgi:carboxypeptidase D